MSVDYLGRGVLRPAHIHPEGLRTLRCTRAHARAHGPGPRARARATPDVARRPTRPRPNNSSHGEVVARRATIRVLRGASPVSIFGK